MKGYTSHRGFDCAPCFFYKHRAEDTTSASCYSCMDNSELALHLPNAQCDFAAFEPLTNEHLSVLLYEQRESAERKDT